MERDVASARVINTAVYASLAACLVAFIWGEDFAYRAHLFERPHMVTTNLVMGEFACIGPRVRVYSMATVTFCSYSIASQGAHLCAGTHDVENIDFQLEVRPILLGYYAWIAAEAFVGPGVVVGDGAVLGARGCAFRDLDPWTIYVGNPARQTRKRMVRISKTISDGSE